MEKSLERIQESLNTTTEKAGKANSVLASLSSSLGSMLGAMSQAKISKKQSDTILGFTQGLADITKDIDAGKAKEFGEAMGSIGEGILTLTSVITPGKIIKLHIAAKILFEGKKPLLERIAEGMTKAFTKFKGKNVQEGAAAMKDMGEGLLSLSKAMARLALVGIMAPLVLMGALAARGVVALFIGIGAKAKNLKDGADAFKTIGKGILFLTAGLAALTLAVMVIGPAKILEGIVVISAFALVFALIGMADRHIRKGAKALAYIGLAMFAFSAGLAMLMLAIIIATPKLVLEGILYIAAFGLVFALLGKADKYIAQGALLMIGMAVALFLFSGGLMVFGLALKLFDWESAVLGGVLILGLGLAMAAIGKFDKHIDKGALALVAMGVGLALFSVGLMLFGLVVKLWLTMFDEIGTAGVVAGAMILGFGLAIAGVGLAAGYVVAGSIALAAMGVGLSLFSIGVMLFGLSIKLWMSMFDNLAVAGIMAAGLILGLGGAIALLGLMAVPVIFGSAALAAMGVGLALFSVGLAMFVGVIKLIQSVFDDLGQAGLIAGGVILGLGLAMAILGVMAPLVIAGSIAMTFMGVSLIAFSVGLLAFVGVVKLIESVFGDLTQAAAIAGGIIIGMGLAYSVIGLLIIPIVLGAVSATLMGATLLIFSVGLLAFAGAVAVAMKAVDAKPEELGDKMGTVLTGIGWAFGSLGALIIPIVFGTAAAIVMSAGMLSVGVGLLALGGALALANDKGILIEDKDGWTLKGLPALTSIAKEFASIGWTFLWEPWAFLGIATSISMGISLATIGGGLMVAATALEKIPDMSKFVSNLFADDTGLIPAMANAFGDIGVKYSPGVLGFLAGLIGADPIAKGMRTVSGMGEALQQIAGGIVAFADFSAFPVLAPDPSDPSKLVYDTVDIFGKVMPGIQKNLPPLLTTLADTFAVIGILYGGTDGSWFSSGSPSPVKKGMDAISGLGNVLSEVAGGIVAFSRFDAFPVQVPDESDPSKLVYQSVNLWDTAAKMKEVLLGGGDVKGGGLILTLAGLFADIGDRYGGEEGGWFSSGSPSPVRKGIDAISGLGKEIEAVVGSIVKFANFETFPVQIPDADDPSKLIYKSVNLFDVIPKMQKVLFGDGSIGGGSLIMSLADLFAQIGNRYGETEGGWFTSGSPSPVRKGIDAISGLGKELESIVGSIVKFANFETFPIQIPDPDNPEKLIYKSVNLFDMVPKMTEMLAGSFSISADGKWNVKQGLLMSLANIFASIGAKYGENGFMAENGVKQGVDAVQGIGKVLGDIAGGIIAFGEIERGIPIYDDKGKIKEYKPYDMAKISATIKNILTMLPDVFAGLDLEKMESAKDIAKKAKPLAESIGAIAESLQKLMVDDDKKKKKSIVGELGPALRQFIEDTKDLEVDEEKTKSLDKLAKVLTKLSGLGDGLSKFADSLTKTSKAFGTFTPAFDKFSTKLDQFDRFENSFSNLVKNQSHYKFDQFSKSMGILKDNINAFNVENLKVTDSLMKSLAILSKSPDALGKQIQESIEKAFADLVEALKKMVKEASPPPPPPSSPPPPGTPPPSGTPPPKGTPPPPVTSLTKTEIQDAFFNALTSYGVMKKPW